MQTFLIDEVDFSSRVVANITRRAEIRDTDLSGTMLGGEYHRDIMGTYYTYQLTIAVPVTDTATYTELYQLLTQPVESHQVVLPYNQSVLEITAYIKTVTDRLYRQTLDKLTWNTIVVEFVGASPSRIPT